VGFIYILVGYLVSHMSLRVNSISKSFDREKERKYTISVLN